MATQVTVITGEGSTTYSVSTGARGPAGPSSGATPAGTTGSVQINNAGALAADSGLVYTGTGVTGVLKIGGGSVIMSDPTVSQNVAIGGGNPTLPFANRTTGNYNTAIGTNTLPLLETGNRNIAIGTSTLTELTTGSQNFGLGVNTLNSLTSGSKNVAIGDGSGLNLTTGVNNIFIGTAVSSAVGGGTDSTQIVIAGTSDGPQSTVIGFDGRLNELPTQTTRFIGNTITWGDGVVGGQNPTASPNNRTSLVQSASTSAKTITLPNATGKLPVYTDTPAAGQVLTATDPSGAATWEDVSGGNLTSGPVTSTAGASAIADGALTVAKTSGLEEAIIRPRLVAFLGDSITGVGQSNTQNESIFPGNLFPAWVKFTLNGRIDFLTQNEFYGVQTFGFSGYKINDIRGTVLSDGVTTNQGTAPSNSVAIRSADLVKSSNGPLAQLLSRMSGENVLVVEMTGTNDVISDAFTSASFHATKRGNLWREMISAGIPAKRIVALELPPIGGSPTARMTQVAAVNALCQADAATLGIYWLNYPAIMLSGGTANAGYYRQDLIHPNALGAKTFGENVANFISPMVATTQVDIPVASDPRWLTPNPYVAGTVAVSGTRFSGNIPTNWVATASDTDVTGTFSKVVNAANQNIFRIVTTGTNRHGGANLKLLATNTYALPAGTTYRLVARLKGSGFSNINLLVVANSGINVQLAQNSSFPTQDNTLDLTSFEGVFESPIVQTLNTVPQNELQLWFAFSGQGTVDISQIGLLEVLPFPTRPSLPLNTSTVNGLFIGNYTVQATDSVLFGDATATNPMTFTLPLASTVKGKQFRLKKIDVTAGVVRFACSGGQLIEGAATYDLSTQWATAVVTSMGTYWAKY